jgi:uncharacterized protein (DUF3820 family)
MARLTDQSIMPLGSHRGKAMDKVPDDYLLKSWDKHKENYKSNKIYHASTKLVLEYIEDNLDAIKLNINQ